MSLLTFMSSDFPLENVENPHIKFFSINEALEKGIDIPEIALNSSSIDRNKPGVLLWIDDEKNRGEITIHPLCETSCLDNIPTSLKYFSTLEWLYTEDRAKKLVEYIRKHIETSNILEIWRVWLGNREIETVPKKYNIDIKDLSPADLEKIFNNNSCFDIMECLVVTRL